MIIGGDVEASIHKQLMQCAITHVKQHTLASLSRPVSSTIAVTRSKVTEAINCGREKD